MKKVFLTTLFVAILALTGCSFKLESSISSESATLQSDVGASTDIQSDTESESKELNSNFLPEEKVAPIITIPSTISDHDPSFETTDAIVEALFKIDDIEYEWDVLNPGYDFITDVNGDILIVTYNVGEEPINVSEYARSIEEEQGWNTPEILNALQEINTLEYIGRAEFIADMANSFEYYNSYLFRYKNKVLLIEPPLDADDNDIYTATMFKPCY